MSPAELLRRLAGCGWTVELTPEGPRVVRIEAGAPTPPAGLLADLKRHREAVIAFLGECEVCGRAAGDYEDRERLRDALFCDRGGSKAVTDGNGVFHPASYRCPYKFDRP